MSNPIVRTSTRTRRIAASALVACTATALIPGARTAIACAMLGGGSAKVAGEEVLVVWDAAHHTEHFVRHLSFRDASHDFGFLVPTPTRPELAEANDSLFSSLFRLYHRVMRSRAIPSNDSLGRHVAAVAVAPVQVLEHRQVAGLDATVLSANDAQALATWLGAHLYPSTPALAQYLEPYVRQHWTVTALRFDPGVVRAHEQFARVDFGSPGSMIRSTITPRAANPVHTPATNFGPPAARGLCSEPYARTDRRHIPR